VLEFAAENKGKHAFLSIVLITYYSWLCRISLEGA